MSKEEAIYNDEGGSAFPHQDIDHMDSTYSRGAPGMTLRDYFAAKALQALCGRSDINSNEQLAIYAYGAADAMIKVRGH